MVFSFIFHKKKERDIVGITVYLNKIENLESMSSSSQIAPFVQFHVKEAKSIQKSKVLKRGAGFLFNDVIFLKAKDSTDQLRLEVYDKSNLLSSTLIATGTLLLSSVQQNAKKSFVVDLSPSGQIHLEIEGFNFGLTSPSIKSLDTERGPNSQLTEPPVQSPYLEIKKIGQGGMGTVFEALCIETKEKVALKKIYCDNLKQLNANMGEATLARGLTHPGLVKYMDVYITSTPEVSPYTLCMVMELMPDGDMSGFLRRRFKKKDHIEKDELLNYMKQITSAIEYLHDKKLVHRDLKPENILRRGPEWKIADFGLMRDISAGFATTTAGTMNYMSPEVASGSDKYNDRADQWSLGCVFYEMMVLKLDKPLYVNLFMNQNFYLDIEEKIQLNYPNEFSDIVVNLLQKDSSKRISSKDLLKVLSGDLKLTVSDENDNVFNSELIQKVPFLKSSDKDLVTDLLGMLKPRVYLKDDLVIKFGDEGNEMFFLSKGIVSAYSADRKQVFNILSEGSFFGEFALLHPIKRTANIVVTSESCDVFVLSKEDLTKIIEKYPSVGLELKKYGLGSLLKKIPLFQGHDQKILDEISVKFTPSSYKTTDIIIDCDIVGDYLYLVYNGVASYMNPEQGIFKMYQIGDCFGQECLDSGKYSQKVMALSGVDTMMIKSSDFKNLSEKFDFLKQLVQK